jgi:3-oxoacyl-[acyl-carrier-protein] synthase-3
MRIAGIGSAIPRKVVTNEMLSEFLETSDEWITSRTGIRERHVLSDEKFETLAAEAAEKALADAGIGREEIELVLCSTATSPYITPSLACVVREALQLPCPAMDLNAACAGFLYALDVADAYLRSGKAGRILLICADNLSRIADWQDRSTCVLFGDAAAALVLTDAGEDLRAILLRAEDNGTCLMAKNDSGNSPFLAQREGGMPLQMEGQTVFRHAVASAQEDICAVLQQAGMEQQAIDHFLLHQANIRIVDFIRKKMGLPEEKFDHNIERYGNTSSASIPLLMDELYRSGRLKKGEKLLLNAFGAGFVSGACVLEWNK